MALYQTLTIEAPLLQSFEVRPPLEFAAMPGLTLHLFSLERSAARLGELSARLSSPEIERAAEMPHAGRRTAFVASRALLRAALTEFSKGVVPMSTWAFGTGPHGKPHVTSPHGFGVRFSLSYTQTVLAIAVSQKYELGVDIEALPADEGEVPWQVLTQAERQFIRTLPAPEQFGEFLRLWTLKEAYTKYLGVGASLDFRKVEVSLDPGVATARSEAETRLPDPMVKQTLIDAVGRRLVLAIAAGKATEGRFVAPAGEAVTLLRRV